MAFPLKALFASLGVFAASCGSAIAGPAIWTLSDDDTVVHLFGTIHLLPEDLEWRDPVLDAAFEASDTLCVETDIVGNLGLVFQTTMQEGVFSGDERLSDHLTPKQEEDLRAIAEALGVLYHGLDVQKPWNAMFSLSEALAARSGLEPSHGVEMSLLPEAIAAGKTICEMETPVEHITSISRLPLDVQIAVLTHDRAEFETVDDAIAASMKDIDEMVGHWLTGDVEALGEGGVDAFGHPDFYDAILTKRNQSWVPRIEALLDEPGTKFVAVGAAHLAGADSVVTMLRDRGHAVDGP